MALNPCTNLGPYELQSPIGVGGTARRRSFSNRFFAAALGAFCILLTSAMCAQNAADPHPVPVPAPVPAPVDQPYPGTISLSVDLTNVNDRVLNVREAIPVKPGEITLHVCLGGAHRAHILLREVHAAQQILEARVGTQKVPIPSYSEVSQRRFPLVAGFPKPAQDFSFVPGVSV
jgi:hypothetical protein